MDNLNMDNKEAAETLSQKKKRLLALLLEEKGVSVSKGKTILPQKRTGDLPLSFAQQRLWFIEQLAPGCPAYNGVDARHISGPLNTAALERAFNEIVRRHEVLRTCFTMANKKVAQVIVPELTLRLAAADLRYLPAKAQPAEVQCRAKEEAQRPFDLKKTPLLRVTLLRLAPEKYILLTVIHHIVSDGWSTGIIIRELSALYEAYATDTPSPLPELPVQYADFAVWQKEWLAGDRLKKQRNYWKLQLKELSELNLPADRPHPSVPSFQGAKLPFRLSGQLTAALNELSRQSGATLFMTLFAGFAVLLCRYSDQEDVAVGSPIANRNHKEIEPLIGFFVNTLVLRAGLSGNPTFRELLARVRKTALDAYANQDLPFEELAEELQPERNLNRNPLVQVAFALQNAPLPALHLRELRISPLELESETVRLDLEVHLWETEGELAGHIDYSTDLFDAAFIARMAEHFRCLLEGAAADPDGRIRLLPLLSATERRQLLTEWNDTDAEYPHDKCIHQLFEAQAERSPDAIAVMFQEQSLTYRELNARADQLARYLRGLGVKADVPAGICAHRSLEMTAGLLGVLKAGGAYLPLDPELPPERLAFMLKDSRIPVLLTQKALLAELPQTEVRTICLDTFFQSPLSQKEAEAALTDPSPLSTGEAKNTPENLSYIIYTSGSTGLPKGVTITHKGLCNLAMAQIQAFGVQADSRVLQFASFSFDASVSETFMALCAGACLYLDSAEALLPGPRLIQLMRKQGITHATFPPSSLAALPVEELPALRVIIVAGEACPPELAAQWSKGRRFFNAYGPTETSVCATIAEYGGSGGKLPIGRPIANTRVYVLDRFLQPVPAGVAGELHIGGAGLARKYLNRPELTREKFISFEASGENAKPGLSSRVYKTGDSVRHLPDGNLEFLGRLDHQIKLRGYRIELGEIEHALVKHAAIGETAVLAVEDSQGEKSLTAYFTRKKRVELWPSIAEFFVYDEIAYQAMSAHTSRNRCYLSAFKKVLKGKKAVEIGPGPELILSRLALEAGAEKIYAIELLEETWKQAKQALKSFGLEERIILIHADAREAELPEKVDYCISEIIGGIGGSEGAARIINDARRFLHDGRCMIPQRSLTKIAAITLPQSDFDYSFPQIAKHYVDKIFAQTGYAFDLRLCVKNLPFKNIISTTDTFEDLDYACDILLEMQHNITLIFEKDAVFNGFLVWLCLYTDQKEVIDILEQAESWLPIYFPVFEPGITVSKGDVIRAAVSRKLCKNGVNPDYSVHGRVIRKNGGERSFRYEAPHFNRTYKGTPFYARLFAGDSIPVQPELSSRTLRVWLKRSLPDYMLPSRFLILENFPLTPSGKIDRHALSAPDTRPREEEYAAPRTPVEKKLAAIWVEEILGLDRAGIHDNFFELGGHSLLATLVISQIRDTFAVEIPLRRMFESPTIAELGKYIEKALPEGLKQSEFPLKPVSREGDLPLSFAQQRLWFLGRLEGKSATYNIPGVWRIAGSLHIAALEQSLREIVRRHEALRTVFPAVNGIATQVIASVPPAILPIAELGNLPESERSAEIKRLAEEEAQKPFDLAAGPMLRASLLRLGESSHILLLTMHHIVSDGWSMGIFIRELAALYKAFSREMPSPLAELPIQYADFAHWQRQWLSGETLKAELDYWKRQLAGLPPLLELPLDRPRGPVQTFRGGRKHFEIAPDLTQRLKTLSRQSGSTLFMTLLAAFAALLSRYSAQEDIAVGSPIANRNRGEIESLIGFFVNTLVLRMNLAENPAFSELLEQVRQTALEAYAHQNVPFEYLVETLQPERNLSHTPLFQVMFVLQNASMEEPELPGLSIALLETENATAKFDLSLAMQETKQGLRGMLEYRTDLFDAATIARMAGHFRNLLEGAVADPERRIWLLPLLSVTERRRLLTEWNDTDAEYPNDKCIHQLFEAQAERFPDATAVMFQEQSLTYRELNLRAERLAHYLRGLGVKADVPAGICVHRSLEMAAGVLGVLKAGGAYLPLDPALPAERLAFMLKDSRVSVLLTQEALLAELPQTQARTVCLDIFFQSALSQKKAAAVPANRETENTPENLSYIIYTSGSTGLPKGVAITHRGLCNLTAAVMRAFDIQADSCMLQFASFSFDAFVWEFFMTLCAGAKLYLDSADALLPGPGLIKLMRKQGITHVSLPPSALAVLPVEELPALRVIIAGGEVCSSELAAQWSSKGHRFFNAYGPTEAAVCTTIAEYSGSERKLPIGRPIANTRVYVLDRFLQPVPMGIPGELHIGGIGLAREYFNRPELTRKKFISFEASGENAEPASSSRVYKTGDFVRCLPDGNLEFLGRLDHQIKLRGYRVELGEIEHALAKHAAIEKTAVLVTEDKQGKKSLTAYFTCKKSIPVQSELSPRILRVWLEHSLPAYMIPARFLALEHFPLTSSGKIDRNSLPAPSAFSRNTPEKEQAAPCTPTEKTIAAIWADILKLERAGLYDNFFEAGGHSLLVTQIISRIREEFSVDMPLSCLFESPSVAGIAQAVDIARLTGSPPVVSVRAALDLRAEAVLDPAIRPGTVPVEYVTEPAAVFLTGATGFLGVYLLSELLAQTRADVYCLLRASGIEEGKKKLRDKLESHALWDETHASRIIPVPGDLSQPFLGLSAQHFQQLGEQMDLIYHSGALVNFIYPYAALKAANVFGTREILKLAVQGKTKPVHYVSTLSVFFSFDASEAGTVLESAHIDRYAHGLEDGYSQSKWVAEKLVVTAGERGLPVSVYRPGRITGHSRSGLSNTDDLFARLFKGCIQLGMVPETVVKEIKDMTPVDYVSRAIVHLSRQPACLDKVFYHLANPHPVPLSELLDEIRALGYPLAEVADETWRLQLIRQAERSSENALLPFVPFFRERMPSPRESRFDCRNTLDGLKGTDIICPPVSAELLHTYFSYFTKSGFLT
ncbi:MAG: amino acid adenylation domain-containing protein [Gammaproteobacteria bacterium]|nr:amino acid adenylation domain-containing protein [Gammaproteobacteria bacterium]